MTVLDTMLRTRASAWPLLLSLGACAPGPDAPTREDVSASTSGAPIVDAVDAAPTIAAAIASVESAASLADDEDVVSGPATRGEQAGEADREEQVTRDETLEREQPTERDERAAREEPVEREEPVVQLVQDERVIREEEAREGEAERKAQVAREEKAEREAQVTREEKAEREAQAAREEEAEREAQAAREEKAEREAQAAREEEAEREAQAAREEEAEREAQAAREEEAEREAQTAREEEAEREAQTAREEEAEREARAAREEEAERAGEAEREERAASEERAARDARDETESTTSRFGDAPPLRELAARHGLRIGNSAPSDMHALEDAATFTAILAEEFDILTPENAMKMADIQFERGRLDWEESDRVVDFAERHGMLVHGHPLIWKEQIPHWARALDKPERAEAMREHIRSLVSRYRGRIAVWDVVNEALEEDGRWRHTLWYRALGSDYLRESFVLARELDPHAALIYNDYGIAWQRPKSDALYDLLVAELARGTPIDGVGFQMHLSTAVTRTSQLEGIRANLDRFAELGLDLYITELDVAVDWRRDEAEEAGLQAEVYAEVLRLCLEQPRCRALQIWGLSDEHSWRGALEATPFGEGFSPKPAFRAMQRVLQETPVASERLERAPNSGASAGTP